MGSTRRKRTYTAEQREDILNTLMRAVAFGWSVRKFAMVSRIPRATILTWIMDDEGLFDRYMRATEAKAVDLVGRADSIVQRLINPAVDPKLRLEAKVAGVALRHIEFRLMREFKRGRYNPAQKHEIRDVTDMTDEQLDEEYRKLKEAE